MAAKAQQLKAHLQPGQVYRRAELAQWSNAVDRHVKELQSDGSLKRLSGGLYLCPETTAFGEVPPEEQTLVRAFLKDSRFLIFSSNLYNTLGLGTTQLYNEMLVYNHKRHGQFVLGNRKFEFCLKPYFPKALSEEFLLVDLMNNTDRLAESSDVLERLKKKAVTMDSEKLIPAVSDYGSVKTRKFFATLPAYEALRYSQAPNRSNNG
jgi:hypothetical protein